MIYHGFDPVFMALLSGEEEERATLPVADDPWPLIALSGLALATALGLAALLWLSP